MNRQGDNSQGHVPGSKPGGLLWTVARDLSFIPLIVIFLYLLLTLFVIIYTASVKQYREITDFESFLIPVILPLITGLSIIVVWRRPLTGGIATILLSGSLVGLIINGITNYPVTAEHIWLMIFVALPLFCLLFTIGILYITVGLREKKSKCV